MTLLSTMQVRIREIPVLEKLQYLYFLLSSVLPVVKKIHDEQCSEVELEKKLLGKISFDFEVSFGFWFRKSSFTHRTSIFCRQISGTEIDLFRAKLNADEQMCWYCTVLMNCLTKQHISVFSLSGASY